MARSVRLRPWQKAALERLAQHDSPDFLAVATPGAGKTTFALTAARQDLAAHPGRRLVVVAPTQHLKHQWARAAAGFELHLDPGWSARDGTLASDLHGIVTTYQQVSTSAREIRHLAAGAFVIFDELHHAGDDRAWGEAVRTAFEPAARRLALSGTPFRSDTQAIPFVRYELEEARPDFEYGYGDALGDGRVVRPVYFPRLDGRMEWSAPDGTLHSHTFEDALDNARSSQRLRTALSLEGEWLPTVLRQAHRQLVAIRREQPDAGGLVIAMDQDHARGIAGLLRTRFGVEATVATSDDPSASDRIARFADGTSPWIVAVRMVSEGVDIPRLRVGVFATTTTTELFFRQAVGRLVRWTGVAGRQPAFMFIPDDPRLRARAAQIAVQRRHSLRKERRDDEAGELDAIREAEAFDDAPAEQLSLFAAISATPIGDLPDPEWLLDDALPDPAATGGGDSGDADEELTVTLPPLPGARRALTPVSEDGRPAAAPARPLTIAEQKGELRRANASRAEELVAVLGLERRLVNAELNRRVGLRSISEATVEQLERRMAAADAWLRSARGARRSS